MTEEGVRLAKFAATSAELSGVKVFRKDLQLDRLAERFNVAQFVSFAPSEIAPQQQFCRLSDLPPNLKFESVRASLEALFVRSNDGTVNIRSFSEAQSQSREFIYGVPSIDDAESAIRRISVEGAYTIANETIDVSDGGVSGVAMNGLVEFCPDSTPRGVEKAGFASLPAKWADRLFELVYGFDSQLAKLDNNRVEFSIHPAPRGWRQTNMIFWEIENVDSHESLCDVAWPNDFSRMIGDKVFGLLVAHILGFSVPKTTVLARRVAPFSFGQETGLNAVWTRTSPSVQVPGKFTTVFGWLDPFRLVQDEDPDGVFLASILAQQAVKAEYSGAAVEDAIGELIVEGVKGSGEQFMLGTSGPDMLPYTVIDAVRALHAELKGLLGSVRFEWVYAAGKVWIVQLHRGASSSRGTTIVAGEAKHWVTFDVQRGLEALRHLVADLSPETGLLLNGIVGRTSHFADVVRKANIPTKLAPNAERSVGGNLDE